MLKLTNEYVLERVLIMIFWKEAGTLRVLSEHEVSVGKIKKNLLPKENL